MFPSRAVRLASALQRPVLRASSSAARSFRAPVQPSQLAFARPLHVGSGANAQQAEAPIDARRVQCSVLPSETEPKLVVQWGDGRSSTL